MRNIAPNNRKGAMMPLMGIILIVLLTLVAFTVNISWISTNKSESVRAADLAALSALQNYSENPNNPRARKKSRTVGSRVLSLNETGVARRNYQANRFDFGFLLDPAGNPEFVGDPNQVSSVRVMSNEDSRLPLFFGSILGVDSVQISSGAVSSYRPVDVVMCLDASRSMHRHPKAARANGHRPPPPNSKWFILIDRAVDFLQAVSARNPNTRVSLVTFGGGLFHRTVSPLDADRTRNEVPLLPAPDATRRIEDVMTSYSSHPLGMGTFIYDSLLMSVDVLNGSNPNSEKIIVLLTDGEQGTGGIPTPLPQEAAQVANNDGIVIHTVNFEDNLNAQLPEIAKISGGKHFDASNNAELRNVFQELLSEFKIRLAQ